MCCEELTALGGRRRIDGCWTLELADAAVAPLGLRYEFYVEVDGERVDLIPAERADGTPYLRPADPRAEASALTLPSLDEPGGIYARAVSPR